MLGVQGCCYDSDPSIEFCSLACFRDLQEGLAERARFLETAENEDTITDARWLREHPGLTTTPVVPAGAIFEAYPKDIAAYIDTDGNVVIRRRWFDDGNARDLARWILANTPETADG